MRLKDMEEWITIKDAAEIMGITRQATYKWIHNNRIRHVKTRLGYLLDPEDVQRVARERQERLEGQNHG